MSDWVLAPIAAESPEQKKPVVPAAGWRPEEAGAGHGNTVFDARTCSGEREELLIN